MPVLVPVPVPVLVLVPVPVVQHGDGTLSTRRVLQTLSLLVTLPTVAALPVWLAPTSRTRHAAQQH